MAQKRGLIFSLAYFPRLVGGAEVAVKEITDRIDVEDIEFHMVTLSTDKAEPREERLGNAIVHRIGFGTTAGARFAFNKYLFPFLAAMKGARLHRTLRFDFTWAIMANFAGFAALFFKLFHMDVPFVLTLQEGDPIEYIKNESFKIKVGSLRLPVRFLVYPFFEMIFTHADRIQAISRYLADFGKGMGAKADPVVVPNGVDVDKFSTFVPQGEIERVRQEIGKGDGEAFVVTASRLVAKNAVGDIVAALPHLAPSVKLLVVGQGPLEAELRASARRLGVESRVVFKGYVPHADLPAYLQASDVFVRPSLSEGFGNSFIEAMAAGIPVVATPVGGIVDFLKDKETGLFCEVGNPEDVARKVQVALQDKGLREEIVDNALHMVVDRYDWKIVAKQMKEQVFDMLKR